MTVDRAPSIGGASSQRTVNEIRAGDRVALYGAGAVGHDVLRLFEREGITVTCLLDKARAGQEILGLPVRRPESCPLSEADRSRIPVVIAIFNRGVNIPAVADDLRRLGFRRIVSFVDLHAMFPEFGDRYWLTRREYVAAHADAISSADDIWADAKSREVFRSLINFRLVGAYGDSLTPRPDEVQYFPTDIPDWPGKAPLRFVDGGAYDGDTLRAALTLGLSFEASAHFEPDPTNFAALVDCVRQRTGETAGSITLWPCALSDHGHIAAFTPGRGEGGGVSPEGNLAVPAVALDDVLVGWRPSFIKLDIEGSELEALAGARRLIRDFQPKLAVCVYHRPDHLWRIALVLRERPESRKYRLYLRVHGYDGFDTVLYACPEWRS